MKSESVLVWAIYGVLALRHIPQIGLDVGNWSRPQARRVSTRIRAWHIWIMWLVILAVMSWRIGTSGLSADTPTIVGVVGLVFGTSLGLAALWQLRHSYSQELVVYEDSKLVVHGVYALVRHPLRLALTIELAGAVLIAREPALMGVLAAIIVAQAYRSKHEDALLVQHFGEEAQSYQYQTPAFNLPLGIWRVAKRDKRRSSGVGMRKCRQAIAQVGRRLWLAVL